MTHNSHIHLGHISVYSVISDTHFQVRPTHFYGTFAFSDVFLTYLARRLNTHIVLMNLNFKMNVNIVNIKYRASAVVMSVVQMSWITTIRYVAFAEQHSTNS